MDGLANLVRDHVTAMWQRLGLEGEPKFRFYLDCLQPEPVCEIVLMTADGERHVGSPIGDLSAVQVALRKVLEHLKSAACGKEE